VAVRVDPLRALRTRHREREARDRDGLAERAAGADGYDAGVISQIDILADDIQAKNLRLKWCCQVVLNHCVKASGLFLAVVTVDYGLPDERVEFSFAQLAHAMRLTVRRRRGAPFRGLPLV
jgi:hypothetical protein